jgi:mono/diheme cytochrome c family protein
LKTKISLILLIIVFLNLSACQSQSEDPAKDPLVFQGERVFSEQCASCHNIAGASALVGPSLEGIATLASQRVPGQDARTYLEESILQPEAYIVDGYSDLMPKTFANNLDQEKLDALLAYMLTLE